MKTLRKVLIFCLLSTSIIDSAKSEWDTYATTLQRPNDQWELKVFKCESSNGDCTLGGTRKANMISFTASNSYVDSENNLILSVNEDGGTEMKLLKFDGKTDSFSELGQTWRSNYGNTFNKFSVQENPDGSIQLGGDTNDIDVVEDGLNIDGAAVITKNSDGSIQIGTDGNDIDITAEGLNVDGNPLITQKENGEIHIGKNSLITTKEEKTLSDGTKVQPLYAEDGDGNRIPINIDGSKLLIDGVEVIAGGDNAQVTTNKNNISTNKANINNLGEGVAGSTALTAALSALPQTSKESKLSCGVGTGAYSSRYAVGFGCASKLNERVDVNAGGSYVFGGSKSYGSGTLDSGVMKAGFVFKLGKINKDKLISKKENQLDQKVTNLQTENKELKNLIAVQNTRLEKLEKIALALKLNTNLEVISMVK